jgi:hypothetical protein
MVLDVVAFQLAREQMTATARAALPDAPVVPDGAAAPSRSRRIAAFRLRASLLLRELADRIEPVPLGGAGTIAPSR